MKVQNPGLTLQEGRTQVPFLLHPNQGQHHPRPAHPGTESPRPGGVFRRAETRLSTAEFYRLTPIRGTFFQGEEIRLQNKKHLGFKFPVG